MTLFHSVFAQHPFSLSLTSPFQSLHLWASESLSVELTLFVNRFRRNSSLMSIFNILTQCFPKCLITYNILYFFFSENVSTSAVKETVWYSWLWVPSLGTWTPNVNHLIWNLRGDPGLISSLIPVIQRVTKFL